MKHKIALVSVLISMCHLAYAQANKDSLEQTLRANNIEGKIISNSDLGSSDRDWHSARAIFGYQ